MTEPTHNEYCVCAACQERDEQQRRDDELFAESVKVPGWPECGDSSVSIEAIYQAFRRRLLKEQGAQ